MSEIWKAFFTVGNLVHGERNAVKYYFTSLDKNCPNNECVKSWICPKTMRQTLPPFYFNVIVFAEDESILLGCTKNNVKQFHRVLEELTLQKPLKKTCEKVAVTKNSFFFTAMIGDFETMFQELVIGERIIRKQMENLMKKSEVNELDDNAKSYVSLLCYEINKFLEFKTGYERKDSRSLFASLVLDLIEVAKKDKFSTSPNRYYESLQEARKYISFTSELIEAKHNAVHNCEERWLEMNFQTAENNQNKVMVAIDIFNKNSGDITKLSTQDAIIDYLKVYFPLTVSISSVGSLILETDTVYFPKLKDALVAANQLYRCPLVEDLLNTRELFAFTPNLETLSDVFGVLFKHGTSFTDFILSGATQTRNLQTFCTDILAQTYIWAHRNNGLLGNADLATSLKSLAGVYWTTVPGIEHIEEEELIQYLGFRLQLANLEMVRIANHPAGPSKFDTIKI